MSFDAASELQRFDPTVPVERATTPPASWYVDASFAAFERRVFRESWSPVARVDQVRDPGVCRTGVVAGEPWVVVRGEDGELRGFLNVCRHHAAQVVTEEQSQSKAPLEELSCPYHGWTYGLDGKLKRAPHSGGMKDFDVDAFGLKPVSTATFGDIVMMRITGDAPFPAGLEALGDVFQGRRWGARKVFNVDCNWKVFVDNYLDGGYHVPVLHGGLAANLDLDRYETTIEGDTVLQTCGDDVLYAWVWPNLMINRYGSILDTNIVLPLDVDRCAVVFDWWFESGVDVDQAVVSSTDVQEEDRLICESVQRGLASSAYDVGRYAPRLEHGMHLFHRKLHAALSR